MVRKYEQILSGKCKEAEYKHVLVNILLWLWQDCLNFKARNVCVMTDSKLAKMDPVRVALESLEQHKVPYQLYDKVRVEPSDQRY